MPPDSTAAPDAAAALARAERLSKLSAADAARLRQRASRKRVVAGGMAERGDRIGARFELAEAEALDRDGLDALDPSLHTTGPIQVGRGGEMATGAPLMGRFLDLTRERPDMLAHDASQTRMDLLDRAGALVLGLDAADTAQAGSSLEKMLMHQAAAAHASAMEFLAEANELRRAFKRTSYCHQSLSVEAGRAANASARMMGAYQDALVTLQRLRAGGRQTVIVQHVNVGDGGQAMVAGQVKAGKRRRSDGG